MIQAIRSLARAAVRPLVSALLGVLAAHGVEMGVEFGPALELVLEGAVVAVVLYGVERFGPVKPKPEAVG